MKIILEDSTNEELEIIIRGDISNKNVAHIISLLKGSNVTSKIILFDDSKEILVDISDIAYFEVINRKNFAKISNGKYICKYSLAEISTMFKKHGITQIAKSILVNVNHVKSLEAEFSGKYIINLKNNEKLIASRFYMKDFKNAIMEV